MHTLYECSVRKNADVEYETFSALTQTTAFIALDFVLGVQKEQKNSLKRKKIFLIIC